jgi:hypothetical protein
LKTEILVKNDQNENEELHTDLAFAVDEAVSAVSGIEADQGGQGQKFLPLPSFASSALRARGLATMSATAFMNLRLSEASAHADGADVWLENISIRLGKEKEKGPGPDAGPLPLAPFKMFSDFTKPVQLHFRGILSTMVAHTPFKKQHILLEISSDGCKDQDSDSDFMVMMAASAGMLHPTSPSFCPAWAVTPISSSKCDNMGDRVLPNMQIIQSELKIPEASISKNVADAGFIIVPTYKLLGNSYA